jgi:hypothetical protein
VPASGIADYLLEALDAFHAALFERARLFQAQNTHYPRSKAEFEELFRAGNGFAWAPFCDRAECELEIKNELGVSARNKPFTVPGDFGDRCIWCGQPATTVVVFARSY